MARETNKLSWSFWKQREKSRSKKRSWPNYRRIWNESSGRRMNIFFSPMYRSISFVAQSSRYFIILIATKVFNLLDPAYTGRMPVVAYVIFKTLLHWQAFAPNDKSFVNIMGYIEKLTAVSVSPIQKDTECMIANMGRVYRLTVRTPGCYIIGAR